MNCPNCNSQNNKICYFLDTYRIVKCLDCGMFYNQDFPENKDLKKTFSEKYYSDVQKEAFSHIEANGDIDPSRDIYELGLDYIEKNGHKGSLLDVGCAFGSFLKFASSRGWVVKGVEFSSHSSSYAREKDGLDVFTGNIYDAPFRNEQFDAVTFWDVIEHVREVRKNIQKAAALLKSGGLIIITTDNFEGILSLIAGALYRISFSFFKYPVKRFFIPYNSCYLTRDKLKDILKQEGFAEVYYKGIDYPLDKIRLNSAERIVLGILYKIGDAINMNSQFILIAKKSVKN